MKRLLPSLAPLLCFIYTTAAIACPMCKDSIGGAGTASDGSGGPSAALPAGFNTSIYFLFISLFAMIAMVSFNLYKAARSTNISNNRGFPIDPPKPPTNPTN